VSLYSHIQHNAASETSAELAEYLQRHGVKAPTSAHLPAQFFQESLALVAVQVGFVEVADGLSGLMGSVVPCKGVKNPPDAGVWSHQGFATAMLLILLQHHQQLPSAEGVIGEANIPSYQVSTLGHCN
jgi:hypothetical protein